MESYYGRKLTIKDMWKSIDAERIYLRTYQMDETFSVPMIEKFFMPKIRYDLKKLEKCDKDNKQEIIGSKAIVLDKRILLFQNAKTFMNIPIEYVETKETNDIPDGIEIIVLDVEEDGTVIPYYTDGEYHELIININDIGISDKGYLERIKNKKRLNKDEKRILEDISIIEEMKSKVNEKDIRKIYAGSMSKIPNYLKGIKLLLNQWAFNKKEIYKLFGNSFSIKREIEYTMTPNEMESEKQGLLLKFPGIANTFNCFDNRELVENKLHHKLGDFSFNHYSRIYDRGERISKIIDELFHHNELNIAFSKLIDKTKLTGIIEISIDPIEFLLMSCNKSGWDSCHTIYRNSSNSFGCYSSGIFSYMCDDVSLIAFRCNGEKFSYRFENQKIDAYSKNWRQIIWLDKNKKYFVSSRQYPLHNEEINKNVRELLQNQLLKFAEDTEKESCWVHSKDESKITELLEDKRMDRADVLHYNDMLNGYEGDLSYIKGVNFSKLYKKPTIVGSHPVCPTCGENLLIYANKPLCKECAENTERGRKQWD